MLRTYLPTSFGFLREAAGGHPCTIAQTVPRTATSTAPISRERGSRPDHRAETLGLIASMLVVPSLLLSQLATHERSLGTVAAALDWVVWGAFTAEMILALASTRSRWRWLLRHPVEFLVVTLTIPLMPAPLQAFQLIRLLRALRAMVESARVSRMFTPAGMQYLWLLALGVIMCAGTVFARIEPAQGLDWQGGAWWAIVTATTVGYGDVVPATVPGQIIAVLVMFVGLGAVSITTAAIARRFIESDIEGELETDIDLRIKQGFERVLAAIEVRETTKQPADLNDAEAPPS